MSTLHAWLRSLDWFLQISYEKNDKKDIQNKFKSLLNLLVDVPISGFGTTNDGNTAREFSITSQITGIPENFIKRYYIILATLSSSRLNKSDSVRSYCEEIARLLQQERYKHNFSPTVHNSRLHYK